MPPEQNAASPQLAREQALQRIGWQVLADRLRKESPPGPQPYTPGQHSLIAIIDSGLNPHVEILDDRVVVKYNTIDDSNNIQDVKGHGTALAGILAGTGTPGAGHGIAPGAKLIVIKIGEMELDGGQSTGSVPVELVEKALIWLANNHAQIEKTTGRHLGAVCLAEAGGPITKVPPHHWQHTEAGEAILTLRESGVVTVAGAGNSYARYSPPREGMQWPAILPACLSVGATYDADQPERKAKADDITFYSNRLLEGTYATTVFAPGSVITTISNASATAIGDINGTSAATPMVCGSVILIQELFFLRNKRWPTAQEVENSIISSAKNLTTSTGGTYLLLNLPGV